MKTFRRRCQRLLLASFLLAGAACQRPEDPPQPADLLPQEKLIPLLADLHELEARVESSRLSPDSSRALFLAQQKELLWRHEVSDSVFQRSYRYYGIHGKDLNDIYKIVIDTLNEREKKFTHGATPSPDGPPPATWGPGPK